MVSLHESPFKLRFTTNFKVTLFRASMQNTRRNSTHAKVNKEIRQQCQPQRRLTSLARFWSYFSLHFRIRCPHAVLHGFVATDKNFHTFGAEFLGLRRFQRPLCL